MSRESSEERRVRRAMRYAAWRGFRYGLLHPISALRDDERSQLDRGDAMYRVAKLLNSAADGQGHVPSSEGE